MATDAVLLTETKDPIEGEMYREMLAEAGIAVRQREVANPWLNNAVIRLTPPPVELLVAEADAAEAGELVDDYSRQVEAGQLMLPEEDVDQPSVSAVPKTLRTFGLILVAVVLIVIFALYGYHTISAALPHTLPSPHYYGASTFDF